MEDSKSAVARELGAGLRAHRSAAGLTLRELQERSGVHNSTLSRIEAGSHLPSGDTLTAVLAALDIEGDERERFLGLRREPDGPGRIAAGAPTIGAPLTQLVDLESTARRITVVSPLVIPGLLQTEDVARAILAGEPDVETRVALRMGRQRILTRSEQPVELLALIDPEALTYPLCGPRAMASQLLHLIAMAERPTVTIRLISRDRVGFSPHLAGAFDLLEFPTASAVVHSEGYAHSGTLWESDVVDRYRAAAQTVEEEAMSPARTTELIAEIAHGWRRPGDDEDSGAG
jgi:transcriptional regulator with XRE-family HTH domain